MTSADDLGWGLRRALRALAELRPLVLQIEDIHWAEPALLDLLETLVDWPSGAPILLVCPTRPELFDRHPDWCVGRPNATRVDLVALGSPDARALLEGLPGGISLPSGWPIESWLPRKAIRCTSTRC